MVERPLFVTEIVRRISSRSTSSFFVSKGLGVESFENGGDGSQR